MSTSCYSSFCRFVLRCKISIENQGFAIFGPDGNLYVASSFAKKVIRYNGNTGALIGDFAASGFATINQLAGLSFGTDGNLYVSGFGNPSTVARYNGTTGALIGDFVTSGLSGLDHPTYLTFGPPVIYVGQDGLCGGKRLCFTSIQNGIDSAQSFMIMEITQEIYNEDIILDDPKVVTLQGDEIRTLHRVHLTPPIMVPSRSPMGR